MLCGPACQMSVFLWDVCELPMSVHLSDACRLDEFLYTSRLLYGECSMGGRSIGGRSFGGHSMAERSAGQRSNVLPYSSLAATQNIKTTSFAFAETSDGVDCITNIVISQRAIPRPKSNKPSRSCNFYASGIA